mmetsp:Transcript_107588/g.343300  ORF Transcript_107588/g.343300 Transcript_107588/m.343300 type:complete len:326 (+) Transcript_107588:805-1782(+)
MLGRGGLEMKGCTCGGCGGAQGRQVLLHIRLRSPLGLPFAGRGQLCRRQRGQGAVVRAREVCVRRRLLPVGGCPWRRCRRQLRGRQWRRRRMRPMQGGRSLGADLWDGRQGHEEGLLVLVREHRRGPRLLAAAAAAGALGPWGWGVRRGCMPLGPLGGTDRRGECAAAVPGRNTLRPRVDVLLPQTSVEAGLGGGTMRPLQIRTAAALPALGVVWCRRGAAGLVLNVELVEVQPAVDRGSADLPSGASLLSVVVGEAHRDASVGLDLLQHLGGILNPVVVQPQHHGDHHFASRCSVPSLLRRVLGVLQDRPDQLQRAHIIDHIVG